MEYTVDFTELKSVFDPELAENRIPRSGIRIAGLAFDSFFDPASFSNADDLAVNENRTFTYYVFIPEDSTTTRVILLLHGLNERSWVKYLPWAYRLAEMTGSYVVLFPISFHINRSPASWSDRRLMMQSLAGRKSYSDGIRMSSFANIALSNRLTEDPLRFLRSGYQTSCDIVSLLSGIKAGENPLIPKGSRVNIFGYSIGAFLAQILMMGNPEKLFSDSKLFMFCGGSVFSNMQGTSKLIMDSLAYETIYNFYCNEFEKKIEGSNLLSGNFWSTQLGMAFRSMLDLKRFRSFRDSVMGKLRDQVRAIALLKDTVIPAGGIMATMKSGIMGRFSPAEIWDFPFSYTHENPFPVFQNAQQYEVDRSFSRLISEAASFLA
ncbi:MAG: DUF6051 family protein [Bacteroidales bacterium]